MSLRARLLIGLVVLTTAGPGRRGHRHLRGRAIVPRLARRPAVQRDRDQRLRGLRRRAAGPAQGVPPAAPAPSGAQPFPDGPEGPGGRGPVGRLTGLPLGTIGIHVAANGTASRPVEFEGAGASTPKLDAGDVPLTPLANLAHPTLVTVDSEAGSALQYRVLKKPSDTGPRHADHRRAAQRRLADAHAPAQRRADRDRRGRARRSPRFAWLLIRLGPAPARPASARRPARSPRATSRAASAPPTRAPRSVAWASRSTRCSARSSARSASARRARSACGASSPTPRTSCARR